MDVLFTDLQNVRSEMVSRALSGNAQARLQLYELCAPAMNRAIQRVLRGRRLEETIDILHEAFVKLLESLPNLRNPGALTGFARQISQHCAQHHLDAYGDERAIPTDPLEPGSIFAKMASEDESPASQLEHHDLRERLYERLIPQLKGVERQVLDLHFQKGIELQEVATRLGISRNLVDQHKYHLKQLMTAIAAQLTGPSG